MCNSSLNLLPGLDKTGFPLFKTTLFDPAHHPSRIFHLISAGNPTEPGDKQQPPVSYLCHNSVWKSHCST
ncbi:hypothetical protein H4Q26_014108 [Puccinia striiformis f. sp. tritici PST-130]|nr:hypothetical protein H4Q26_014108 [Puccinia striiformis f. sp. tritici PST-130]